MYSTVPYSIQYRKVQYKVLYIAAAATSDARRTFYMWNRSQRSLFAIPKSTSPSDAATERVDRRRSTKWRISHLTNNSDLGTACAIILIVTYTTLDTRDGHEPKSHTIPRLPPNNEPRKARRQGASAANQLHFQAPPATDTRRDMVSTARRDQDRGEDSGTQLPPTSSFDKWSDQVTGIR